MQKCELSSLVAICSRGGSLKQMTTRDFIDSDNGSCLSAHTRDFDHLGSVLADRGLDIESVVEEVAAFEVAVPSWALGTGGTRFGRFPTPGQPRNVFEKFDDIAVIHKLVCSTPKVSLHIPWDEPDDPTELREFAQSRNLGFDAVNSNTFQDQPEQALSYRFGSLSHTDAAVREQATSHILHVIQVGESLGSDAITVWLSDGSNYPGQMHLRKGYERVLACLQKAYASLPDHWSLFTEHKPYEPAFYSTVVQDWGTSLMLAQNLGERARCLVDLGHHLPNTNIEMIVARLVSAGKLGGFHFNDSKYGDDDLTTGSIRPYQLFLVFNELVDAAKDADAAGGFNPAYMIDQSHNVKDPIEALLQTVDALQKAFAKALLVDRQKLSECQTSNDVIMAERILTTAFETDVGALVGEVRRRGGGAIRPIESFRSSGYRADVAKKRQESAYTPPQSL